MFMQNYILSRRTVRKIYSGGDTKRLANSNEGAMLFNISLYKVEFYISIEIPEKVYNPFYHVDMFVLLFIGFGDLNSYYVLRLVC